MREETEKNENKRLNVRLTEQPPKNEILRREIIRKKKKKPDYYQHLANTLDYKQIKEMTYLAIQHKNLEAIMGMLKSNIYAATDALDCDEGVKFFSEKSKESPEIMPEVYFFIRRPISDRYKIIFRRLARQSIIKTSLKISSRGLKGVRRKTVPNYHIGMPEFDLDETIQHNPLKIYEKTLSYEDIYGIKRKRKKRKVVLILDTSGSMYGKTLLNAALTTSVLAYNMEKEDYSIILFNSTAMTLKKIENRKKSIRAIIDEILDSEAVGFTNIYVGLEKGLEELRKTKSSTKEQFAVLITDGNYNRGDNPLKLAKKFPKIHVIGIPADNDADRGIDTCREIAKVGNGKFYAVNNYKEIPRALIEILTHT
ncbi:MAG: VWA domain-containing protein [Candidatus Lokiarchaeota archaeon]|nr:VWA domain-containing protein [Candidatus Lokiarchaeota archaeon]MBD3338897.1 VWA domain-containing protein [Candidatus Lokiarchaeota archaeon]